MKLSPYRALLLLLSLPPTLATYFSPDTGCDYGVGLVKKVLLALKLIRNNIRITSGSNFIEHLTMATAILQVSRRVEGCIVECGSWKGASTANLSLIAALCGRDLEVFDSFEGLPEPSEGDRAHRLLHRGELHTYYEGGWAGTLEEVTANVTKYGAIEVCNFNKGYFDATLPEFTRPCVFVFSDGDLRESLETCLVHLWPLLVDGSCLYIHEATHMEIASLFFEKEWWQQLGVEPPGLIGAGTGLGLVPRAGGFGSQLGYTVKTPEALSLREVRQ